jgi:myo-inositol-1(or 4)-monophosphatase
MAYKDILERIEHGLSVAMDIFQDFTPGEVEVDTKHGGDPITKADTAVDTALHDLLPRDGEGWLSEETVDDLTRLEKERVWIVDPLDGTKEFVAGIPEWCVSIAYSVAGQIVAAGICNPVTEEKFLACEEDGIRLNGNLVRVKRRRSLVGARILASRSEVNRGQWRCFADEPFSVVPTGSVAYKLALVAAGKADATFSLAPKNEWDIAAGAFLAQMAGGKVTTLDNKKLVFNQKDTVVNGLVAANPSLCRQIHKLLAHQPDMIFNFNRDDVSR